MERRVVLTERDLTILEELADLRLLTTAQIACGYFPSYAAADTRLRLLRGAHYILKVATPERRAVFALSRRGAEALRPRRSGNLAAFYRPSTTRSLGFVAHTLRRNDLKVVLERLHQELALQLVAFRTSSEELTVSARRSGVRFTAVPDAFFAVLHKGRCEAFLVEVDRATIPLVRMQDRYRTYAAWHRSGAPRTQFGGAPLRILTVTTSAAHAEALRKRAPPSPLFWFATSPDVLRLDEPEALLGRVWRHAGPGGDACQLLIH